MVRKRCEGIVDAADGEQNGKIYSAARMFGSLVAGGVLDEFEAITFLTEAAQAGGHPRDRYPGTIRSGMGAGKRDPIDAPPQ